MTITVEYTPRERLFLWTLAVVGFVVLNSVFLYGLLFRPDWIRAAYTNPVSAVFIAEALVLMGAFAWLLSKWKVARLHWGWFVVLSLLGSMAFALPIVLLWPRRGA
jgi:hypothetical protein